MKELTSVKFKGWMILAIGIGAMFMAAKYGLVGVILWAFVIAVLSLI